MKKLPVNILCDVAIVNSNLRRDVGSRVWMIRGEVMRADKGALNIVKQ